ncbi:MAG: dependent oxidoreductase [Bacteroidota bacterium]|jgi:flavin-dependent dehydrogenase|nr:dependent oxidoreductase [Bacteroidota bacterium]
MKLFDVIIIGGGPSGSTAASLLAEKGYQVLVLEKEEFPREHIGESLIPASYDVLSKLGVLKELERISPRKPGVNFIANDGETQSLWCFKNVVKDESYLSFHVKRSAFDKMLLDNSRAKGAIVLEKHAVKHVDLEKDGLVEVRAFEKDGEMKLFSAKFLIDASGQSTFLGSKFGVKKLFQGMDRVALWSHWSGADYDVALQQGAIKIVYLDGDDKKGWFWVIPLSKDSLSIGAVVNNSFLKNEKTKYAGTEDWKHAIYMNEINNSRAVSKLLTNAKMDHKVQLNGDYSYYCEKKYGNNFAMIGDAGAFLDPIFSSGIFVGMHSAELVSEAVHQKLSSANVNLLDDAYVSINGAVKVLEKFITLFYSPENINFSKMGNPGELLQNKDAETIYSIFHFLLSGDFFIHHEKYSTFLDNMRDPKVLAKFQNLINHSKEYGADANCGEDFEEMYGKMDYDVKFDKSVFE